MTKEKQFTFRGTPREMKQWRDRARASDMTLSQWVRRALNDAPAYQTKPMRVAP